MEIQDAYDRELQRLREARDEWLRFCESLPNTSGLVLSPRARCIDDALKFYNDGMNLIRDARLKALDKQWDNARKSREEYERWLREQLERLNVPGIIRDLIKPWLPQGSLTTDLAGTLRGITTEDGVDTGHLSLEGTFTLVDPTRGFSQSGTATAKFSISGTLNGATPRGKIYSGMIDVSGSSGASWTGIVENDSGNLFETSTSGETTITVLVKGTSSVKGWDAVIPAYPRLRLTLQRLPDGSYRMLTANQPSSAVFSRDPFLITDFNGDGARQYSSDYAAFAAALAALDPKADINEDGSWDAVDSDLWLRLFAEDVP